MPRQYVRRLNPREAGVFKSGLGWIPTDTGDDEVAVIFQCPENHRATLMNHSIDSDGTVNASVQCYANCGYHEFVILDNWPATWSKPRDQFYITGAKSGEPLEFDDESEASE